MSCVTVQHLTNLEQNTTRWQEAMADFNKNIKERLQIKKKNVPAFLDISESDKKLSLENDPDFLEEYSKIITDDAVKDLDDLDKDTDANEYDDEYLYQGIELEKR